MMTAGALGWLVIFLAIAFMSGLCGFPSRQFWHRVGRIIAAPFRWVLLAWYEFKYHQSGGHPIPGVREMVDNATAPALFFCHKCRGTHAMQDAAKWETIEELQNQMGIMCVYCLTDKAHEHYSFNQLAAGRESKG